MFGEQTLILKHTVKAIIMLKRIILFTFIVTVNLIMPAKVLAGPTDPCTAPEDPCPIDSNLVVLMIAAAGIAAKKAYDHKKKTHTVTVS